MGRNGITRAFAAGVGALLSVVVALPAGAATAERDTASVRAIVDCLTTRNPVIAPVGWQQSRFTTDIAADTAVDAQSALWLQVDNWPVSFTGGPNACWYGGRIIGTFPQTTRWDQYHHTGGLNFQSDRFTLLGLRVHNYGDGIRVRDGARDFTISGAHLSFIHDDCVENDQLYTGVVEDSLLDGCYVAFSARPSSGDQVDGHTNTYTIRDNVVRLQAMPTVYKGKAPGHGGFFKWADKGTKVSPKLVVRDNVFRVDSRPNHQTLGLPAGYDVKCSNNVVVWLGKGRYPDRLPKCFTVTRDRKVWDRAVAAWHAAHPLNP
ncbi:MAG: hypothetical protein ABJC79_00970 [Acidimicrobiia bacterium]